MILKWLLYENQQIWIIGSVGSQSIEAFKKVEDLAMQRIQSSKSLKDIFAFETVKSPACKTGFVHNPASHIVKSYNDSFIATLNGDPNNIRSKRSTLVFFDESAFSSEELLTSGIAFATQNMDASTSIEEGYDSRREYLKCPTQLLFASSMNDTECLFYKKMKDYTIKMFAGDRNYFVSSMPCDIPLNPLIDGNPSTPLLKQSQIDDEMRVNPQKAKREYYNEPRAESEDQMVKNATILKNSTFTLPELCNIDNKSQYVIASDPARSGDNSILSVMKVCYDKEIGYYGKIVNCVNLIDTTKKRKMSKKTNDQLKIMQEQILLYNGTNIPDYNNIEGFLMDGGSGGQPSAYADNLMEEWLDEKGVPHLGFIDDTHPLYKEEARKYPKASRKYQLIDPKKWRMQMCKELVELMKEDVIKFPREYDGKDYIVEETISENGEIELVNRKLSLEERVALINIDAMKSEFLAIHKFYDAEGNITRYANPNQHAKDDRFYTLLLLAHKLYEIRRSNLLQKQDKTNNILSYCYF